LKRLVDAYEVGAIDVEDLKVRSDAVRARIDRAQRELTDAEHRLRETVHLREVVTRLDDFAARVRQGLGKLSWLERRQIIRALVEKIEIDDAAATVVYRLPSSEREPQSPSGSDPQGEGGPKGDRRTSCLLRTHGVGYVTDRGPS
jgi:site-specific DNA recombinase